MEFLISKGLTCSRAYIVRHRFNAWMRILKPSIHPEPLLRRSRRGHIYDFSTLEQPWSRYLEVQKKFGRSIESDI